jgi:hypothetical protein
MGTMALSFVDLASVKSWRRLHDHPTTKPDPNFVPLVEGEIPQMRLPGKRQSLQWVQMELQSVQTNFVLLAL